MEVYNLIVTGLGSSPMYIIDFITQLVYASSLKRMAS